MQDFNSDSLNLGKKNADRWRPATYEEVLRGMKLEELIMFIGNVFQNT